MAKAAESGLLRTVGVWQGASLVVGTIIGTGIFLKTATMTQTLGSLGAVIAAWIIAGVLSYAGALTYAELSSRFPRSGGEYAILREGYGKLWSFLYGWMRFWIGSPGSIAAYAVGAATFLAGLLNLDSFPGGPKGVALAFVLFFSSINCLQVSWGARVQLFLTVLKVLSILGLIFGVFFFGQSEPALPFSLSTDALGSSPTGTSFVSAFGLALIAALWAYDGWNNLPMVGDEIKDPQRTLPRALGLGVLAVVVLYVSVNIAYFNVLSVEEIQRANSSRFPEALPVATLAAKSFLGNLGVPLLSLAFVISALGAMNGSILTGARVPYAMAQDGLFWKKLATVTSKSRVPVWSVIVQGIWASVLALSGTFDQLTDYVVIASWVFYAMTAATVFLWRRRDAGKGQGFRVPGYPWVPLGFIAAAAFLISNSLLRSPVEGVVGLGLLLLGVPVFIFFQKK